MYKYSRLCDAADAMKTENGIHKHLLRPEEVQKQQVGVICVKGLLLDLQ